MENQTVRQFVTALNSDHVKIPSLLEAILTDLKEAGFPPDMEVTMEMDISHATPGTFRGALSDALCACS